MSFVKAANEIVDELGDHAGVVRDDAKKVVSHARTGVVDLGVQIVKLANKLMTLEAQGVESTLSRIGLQRKESFFRPFGYFAAGALAGGAIAVFFAPVAGKELRSRLAKFLDGEVVDRVKHVAGDARETAGKIAGNVLAHPETNSH